jgi:hypothetical protein
MTAIIGGRFSIAFVNLTEKRREYKKKTENA